MYKVFNMGHRLEVYVKPDIAQDIIQIAKSFNVDARIVGHCEKFEGKQVTINSEKGHFTYR